jgi:hypothetical protein
LGNWEILTGRHKYRRSTMGLEDLVIKEIKSVIVVPMKEGERKTMEIENKFYKAERDMVEVSKEEFINFVNNYPRPLDMDVCGVSDPPLISYNDFELANRWPYSIIASTFAYSDNPKDYFYCPPEERTYRILKNYQECFDNKTGYKEE